MTTPDEDDFGKYEDREDAMFGNLFGEEPPEKAKAEEPEKPDEIEVPEEEDEPGPENAKDSDDSDDEDYDAPAKPKDEKLKDEDDTDPERDPKDETAARRQAKENGRLLKAERARAKELELEAERARAEAAEARKAAEETRKVRIKPMEDPEYRQLHDSILTDVREESELLPAARGVPTHFPDLVTDYLAARKAGDGRDKAIEDLRTKIIEKCILKDIPYDELDDMERERADAAAAGVLKILRGSADKVQKALDLATKLTEEGETGEITLRQRDYERTVGSIKPVVEGLGDLADDLIEANPYAVESVIAKMVKESPEAKRRSERAKRDIEEVFAGPRPLTPAEVQKLKTEGTDLKSFEAERRKAHEAKKNKFIAYLYHGVMARGELPAIYKELAELRGTKEAETSEKDTLREVLRKKPGAPKADPGKPVSAGKRKNVALATMLGDDPDGEDDW